MRRGNGEGEDGAKVRVSLSSLLGQVRVRMARVRVRVRRDKGGEDGTRVRVRVQIFIALGRWSGDPVRSTVTVHPLMSGQVPNLLQWEVSGVDSGPQPQPQKGVQVGGRTLAGTSGKCKSSYLVLMCLETFFKSLLRQKVVRHFK